jgi:hypothetical protein
LNVHYLVKLETQRSASMEQVADRGDVYVSPEGDQGWVIVEAEDEDSLRRDLEGQEVEEVQPVLPAREYAAILGARRDLENSKSRFVDDPSEALAEARQAVGQALEARGYPPPERANEAPRSRQEVLQEYQDTDTGDSGSLEDMRSAFNHLSNVLDRLTRA